MNKLTVIADRNEIFSMGLVAGMQWNYPLETNIRRICNIKKNVRYIDFVEGYTMGGYNAPRKFPKDNLIGIYITSYLLEKYNFDIHMHKIDEFSHLFNINKKSL